MSTTFVLIDFENVQPTNLRLLSGGSFRIKVFLGSNQSKIPVELARALQPWGPDAEYVQIAGTTSNALDFHIAYYIGRLSVETPGAEFHIVSKDTGFDPLIKHLKTQKVRCQRSDSIADLLSVKPVRSSKQPMDSTTASEKLTVVTADLAKRGTARPGTPKTLAGTIKALFAKKISDAEVSQLVELLVEQRIVTVSDGKVRYQLPTLE